ncbi:RecQ family ATP-dependent DNA helicase [Bifidobacterium aemilianum]|uniref:RecQ family ATP-dependent DNA helicase n=1 Tax=Bifidobacterium aemilianum TaxID=2493120 RepID=UPI0038B28FB2
MDASDQALAALKQYFGYDSFRQGQAGLVEAILEERDVLGVMPTGAGKSICYQVPATLLGGLTIVISPLISLMRDQVDALNDVGISAAFVNGTQSADEQGTVLSQATRGDFRMLYVAPERLETERFRSFCQRVPIDLVTVDEAHCVSQWGQDFRSSYLGISDFLASLPSRPRVAAFTATATERVRRDIVALLGLRQPEVTVTGFDRPNLYFDLMKMPSKNKNPWIIAYAKDHQDESGIVYCATRKETEALAQELCRAGLKAAAYHGGMAPDERNRAQRDFVEDNTPVVVATNAFGMGIDKSNVRYVIHHNMPESIEAYYQEAGRAGRDGEPGRCTLLWNESDIVTRRRLLDSDVVNERLSPEEHEAVRFSKRRLLGAMIGYCRTTDCLHRYMTRYFADDGSMQDRIGKDGQAVDSQHISRGESDHAANASLGPKEGEQLRTNQLLEAGRSSADGDGKFSCGNCSNCESTFETIDVSRIAQTISRCVHDLNQSFGSGKLVAVLRGSQAQELISRGLDKLPSYGALKDETQARVRDVLSQMATDGFLSISEGRMPIVGFGPRAGETAQPDFHYEIKRLEIRKTTAVSQAAPDAGGEAGVGLGSSAPTDEEDALFERLRTLRREIARELGMPPYIVFSDKALRDMARLQPQTDAQFLAVNGVGQKKLDQYGKRFMEAIGSFRAQ